jgi:hypothetical protein
METTSVRSTSFQHSAGKRQHALDPMPRSRIADVLGKPTAISAVTDMGWHTLPAPRRVRACSHDLTGVAPIS